MYSVPLGESPPPPPRACFGRDELIEEAVNLAEDLTPIALIGAGGIGKTAVALTVLHHDRIKQRFGDNRWFIRCDQFSSSRAHFLGRLSNVIGAGVNNPEDLAPLRHFLSSTEMILVLDNAESILDPQGTGAREIFDVVEELSEFKTICLCITSRISTVPRHCRRPTIPTLSTESACNIFYGIYHNGDQSDVVGSLLRRLDFHPLSITLLAMIASHNMWDYDRLSREWDTHRVQVLRTDYNMSLAATIELSLSSPTFSGLGPNARDLLSVTAFFPQGISENNLAWLFPTISNREEVFDKFCVLSLTHRSSGFVTMLAPLRDYLRPKDPASCPLLQATKERYFNRVSVRIAPGEPGFEEAQWITSEDVNVEHLLDVFTTINSDSDDVWDACLYFMQHLFWHKKRRVILGPKIEGLPDRHRSKPLLLLDLSQLISSVGDDAERKRLLILVLELWKERGDDLWAADTLRFLAETNRQLGLNKEGIEQVKETLEVYERFNDKAGQARSWRQMARLLLSDDQLDAAEEATSRAIDLLPDEGQEFLVCQHHRLLGDIFSSKGETAKAIGHFEIALGIASSSGWGGEQFWIHYSLAWLFSKQGRFGDSHVHIGHAKLHMANHAYNSGRVMDLEAKILHAEHKLDEAKSEVLRAIDVFEVLGAGKDLELCRNRLRKIEREMN